MGPNPLSFQSGKCWRTSKVEGIFRQTQMVVLCQFTGWNLSSIFLVLREFEASGCRVVFHCATWVSVILQLVPSEFPRHWYFKQEHYYNPLGLGTLFSDKAMCLLPKHWFGLGSCITKQLFHFAAMILVDCTQVFFLFPSQSFWWLFASPPANEWFMQLRVFSDKPKWSLYVNLRVRICPASF